MSRATWASMLCPSISRMCNYRDVRSRGAAAAARSAGVTYLWNEARLRLPLSHVRSLREVRQARLRGQGHQDSVRRSRAFMAASKRWSTRASCSTGGRSSSNFRRWWPAAVTSRCCRSAARRRWRCIPTGRIRRSRAHSCRLSAHRGGGFRCALAGARTESLVSPGLDGGRSRRSDADESAFGVGLYQAVDVYQRGERAIKYALLFIALTFLTFFAWEQISAHSYPSAAVPAGRPGAQRVLPAADRFVGTHRVRLAYAIAASRWSADRYLHRRCATQSPRGSSAGAAMTVRLRAAVRARAVRGLCVAARRNHSVRALAAVMLVDTQDRLVRTERG